MNNKFKRLLAAVLSLSMVFSLMSANVWATDAQGNTLYVGDGDGKYTTLAAAVASASDLDTIKLEKNVTLTSTVNIEKNLTIDLNEKNIHGNDVRALNVKSGNVTITGKGTISANKAESGTFDKDSSVIRVGDGFNTTDVVGKAASLTVGEYVTVSSPYCYGITVFGTNDTDNNNTTADIALDVKGTISVSGKNAAISGNGTNNLSATTMTISGKVSATQDYAIYHPGKGTLTVTGTVEGKGGIEGKGGTIYIENGAVVKATATEQSHAENNNGTSTSGYALAAVVNANYVGPSTFNVSGGEISGKIIALRDNGEGDAGSISITGGTFSSDPTAYVADGYKAVDNNGTWTVKKPSAYGLSLGYKAPANVIAHGSIGDDNNEAVYVGETITLPSEGDEVAINATEKMVIKRDGYKLMGWKLPNNDTVYAPGAKFEIPDTFEVKQISPDSGENQIFEAQWKLEKSETVELPNDVVVDEGKTQGTATVPVEGLDVDAQKEIIKNTVVEGDTLETLTTAQSNAILTKATKGRDVATDTNIVIVPALKVEVTGLKEENGAQVLELEIDAVYTVYETKATSAAGVQSNEAIAHGTLETKGTPVKVTTKLPKSFNVTPGKPLYVKHKRKDDIEVQYTATVTQEGSDFYATFTTPDGFSPFFFSTQDSKVATVNGTDYVKMQDAVDAVTDGGTILIATTTDLATNTDIAKVSSEKTFKVDTQGNSKATKERLMELITTASGMDRTVTEDSTGVFTFKFTKIPGTIIVPSGPTTKPAAPATPVIKEVTDKSIVVNAVAGVEYSIDGGKTWKSAKAGETTVTFDGLTPETTYTVSARVAKTDKAEASDIVTVKVTTKKTETATGTDTPTPTPGPEPEPTPVPTPAPTNPTYDSLSSKEKKNAKAVAKALGVDNETAAQMIKEAAKLGVSIDTVKLGTKTILALKNDNDPKGADFGKLTARATKRTNKAVTLGWKKQKNADGYMIYGNVCGKKYKLLKTIKKKGTTSWTQKKLKKGTNYKYLVVAYKNVNGKKMPIAAAVVVHTNTKGGKVTVAKSLKLNKTKVTVKKGKSFTLKATEVKEDKNLKIKSHRKVKFESSNKKIAKVSSKGKITGVKKGTVTIFAYAQNGIYKTVKVTVK